MVLELLGTQKDIKFSKLHTETVKYVVQYNLRYLVLRYNTFLALESEGPQVREGGVFQSEVGAASEGGMNALKCPFS